jgi:PAS domain S-box-containing protein
MSTDATKSTAETQIINTFTQNEPLFRALIENTSDIIVLCNAEGRITYANSSIERLFGYAPDEICILNQCELVHPEDRSSLREQFATLLEQPGESVTIQYRVRHKNGSWCWVEGTWKNLLTDPAIQALLINIHDIADRKQTEEALRLREEEHYRLGAIVESSNDAIVGKTLQGIITSWNQAAERLFGYTPQEAIGQHITLIIPTQLYSEEEEIISKLRQGIHIKHFETVRRRKDGTHVEVSLSISPIKDSSGKIIGASKIARDITEQKELERRKDEFISMASHELKTPVTSIKGFTQLLLRRFQQRDDKEALHFLSRMDAQLNKLVKLINDLLDISRMQTGQLEYRLAPFELDVLAQDVIENMRGMTQTHSLILENSEQVCVFGDRDRIGQVLINLLTNAIKYSPHADKVLVQVGANGKNAVVRVQDFGIGIAPAYQKKIFERFYQVSEPEVKTYPGLGIGLYISKQIVERHNGRIEVQSRKGEGTTFSVILPLLHE